MKVLHKYKRWCRRHRKLLRRMHNGILYAITTVFFTGCFGSMIAIGTMRAQGYTLKDYAVAVGILVLGMIWFAVFFSVNCDYEGR